MIRLFIALALPAPVEQLLDKIISDFKEADNKCAVKWVKPSNIHLTMKFLGNSEPKLVKHISEAIDNISASIGSFQGKIDRVGAFPNLINPHVIWAGIDGNIQLLSDLSKQLNESMAEFGFEIETRPFKAHLTLGRVRRGADLGTLGDFIQSYKIDQTDLLLDKIVLFKSTLTDQGPIYKRLHESTIGIERFGN